MASRRRPSLGFEPRGTCGRRSGCGMAGGVTSQWVPVELGGVQVLGVEWGWDRAWVYGHRSAEAEPVPYVAHVRDDGVVTAYDLQSRGRITSVHVSGSELAVCLGEAPAELLRLDDSSPTPR